MRLLHLALIFVIFRVIVTLSVVVTFSGDTRTGNSLAITLMTVLFEVVLISSSLVYVGICRMCRMLK